MKLWTVTLPIAGYAVMDVEADNEHDAIHKAMEEVKYADIEEWEAHRHMTQGNFNSFSVNDARAEECEVLE